MVQTSQIETSVDTPVPPPTDDYTSQAAPLASLESTSEFQSIQSYQSYENNQDIL